MNSKPQGRQAERALYVLIHSLPRTKLDVTSILHCLHVFYFLLLVQNAVLHLLLYPSWYKIVIPVKYRTSPARSAFSAPPLHVLVQSFPSTKRVATSILSFLHMFYIPHVYYKSHSWYKRVIPVKYRTSPARRASRALLRATRVRMGLYRYLYSLYIYCTSRFWYKTGGYIYSTFLTCILISLPGTKE